MSQICRVRKSQTQAEGGTQEQRPKARRGSAAGCGPAEQGGVCRHKGSRGIPPDGWLLLSCHFYACLSTCRWLCPQGSKTETDLLMVHVTMLAWQPDRVSRARHLIPLDTGCRINSPRAFDSFVLRNLKKETRTAPLNLTLSNLLCRSGNDRDTKRGQPSQSRRHPGPNKMRAVNPLRKRVLEMSGEGLGGSLSETRHEQTAQEERKANWG